MFFWAKVETEEKGIEIHKMFVIEINVPFGRDNGDSDTLKEAHFKKTGKYMGLINKLRHEFNARNTKKKRFEVEFFTVIVSSLGAIPNRTILNLERILGNKCRSVVGLWAKRLVIAAIKGSLKIWLKGGNIFASNMQPNKSWDKMEDEDSNRDMTPDERLLAKRNLKDLNEEEPKFGIIVDNENKEEYIQVLSPIVGERERMKEIIKPDICMEIDVELTDNDESEIEESGKEETMIMLKRIDDTSYVYVKEDNTGEELLVEPQNEDAQTENVQTETNEEVHGIERRSTSRMRIVLRDGKMFPTQDESEEEQENNVD
jgi:hypothetical protein